MTRSACFFVWTLFSLTFSGFYVASSSNPPWGTQSPPPPSSHLVTSTVLSLRSGGTNSTTSSSLSSSSSHPAPKSSTVTFLYELYEHELYDPATDSWTSRRFTQSPTVGGGGRDSTSLDPSSCSPPRNYLWGGEWKIDMTGETKDGFGWEYYVGRYDGLGRRRRRWVRSLRRVAGVAGRRSGLAVEDRIGGRRNATDTTSLSSIEEKKINPTLLRAIIDQYNFKGFGWSLYKSLIWKKSFGASLRIPLSTNFAFFDRYAAIPFLSSSTYFGYPWVIATFLNASVPLEAIEWVIGGILWKIKWGIAVVSALLRCAIEALVWFVMTPWRILLALRQIMPIVARRYLSKSGMAQSLMDSIDAEAKNDDDDNDDESRKPLKNETKDDNIDGLIELSTASTNNSGNGDISPVTTTAIVGSTRGGALNTATTSPSKRFRTMLGHQVPTFHRTTNIQYSAILSQRFGVCISWRMSKERGYEYRWNFFCSFLPTQECWEHLDKVARKELNKFRRFASKSGKAWDSHDGFSSQSSAIQSFLYDHSATLGLSSGFPLPSDRFFSFNLLLNLSGFYYGWLLRYIASMLCLHRDKPTSDGAEIASGATIEKETENSPLVGDSSALNVERRSEEKEVLDDGSSGEDEE